MPKPISFFLHTPLEQKKLIQNDASHNEIIKFVIDNCVKEDLYNYQKKVFPNAESSYVKEKTEFIYQNNINCLKLIENINVYNGQEKLSDYHKALNEAFKSTKDKLIINNKLLDSLKNLDDKGTNNNQKLTNEIASYVLGTEYSKSSELSAWNQVFENFSNRKVSSINYEYLPIFFTIIITIVAFLLKKIMNKTENSNLNEENE